MHNQLKVLTFFTAALMIFSTISAGSMIYAYNSQQIEPKPLSTLNNSFKVNQDLNKKDSSTLSGYYAEDKEYTIGRGKLIFYRGEGYNNKFKNLEIAFKYLEGYEIQPGQTFSYNETIRLREPKIEQIYQEGIGTHGLLPAGGVCSGSVLTATAISNSKLPYAAPIAPHSIYLPEYYRQTTFEGHTITPVDAAVSTYFGRDGKVYDAADVRFTNNTPYKLIIRAGGDWKPEDIDTNYPYRRNTNTITLWLKINIKEML